MHIGKCAGNVSGPETIRLAVLSASCRKRRALTEAGAQRRRGKATCTRVERDRGERRGGRTMGRHEKNVTRVTERGPRRKLPELMLQ